MKDLTNVPRIEKSMSNFDHTIDEGMEEELKNNPNTKCGHYAGWNFSGEVYYDGEKFKCQVWQYHSLVEEIVANSLDEIMEEVSDKYGYQ